MTRLLRGWTLALPRAGELSRRQKLSGLVSMLAMTAFAWWLAQPVAAHVSDVPTHRVVVVRRIVRFTYVEIIRSRFTTG